MDKENKQTNITAFRSLQLLDPNKVRLKNLLWMMRTELTTTGEDIADLLHETKRVRRLLNKQKRGYDAGYVQGFLAGSSDAKNEYPRWIPLKESLPELHKSVLVLFCTPDVDVVLKSVFMAERINFTNWVLMNGTHLPSDRITHWCELPEPPKEENGRR